MFATKERAKWLICDRFEWDYETNVILSVVRVVCRIKARWSDYASHLPETASPPSPQPTPNAGATTKLRSNNAAKLDPCASARGRTFSTKRATILPQKRKEGSGQGLPESPILNCESNQMPPSAVFHMVIVTAKNEKCHACCRYLQDPWHCHLFSDITTNIEFCWIKVH